jgi:oxygen-independent coproporphyrinogen III oxidase
MDCGSGRQDGKAFVLDKRWQWDNTIMPLGIYISVPFCRNKCSYCNFTSGVFSGRIFDRYVDQVCTDIENARRTAEEMGGEIENEIDSIYLGGGTPTILESHQLERIFAAVRGQFDVVRVAEITVECAPGTLTESLVATLLNCGVNRVSLGVQSFVDQEAAAVGRRHTRTTILQNITELRVAGIANINIDLIAGLPHQTAESWGFSLEETIASATPHVSVYMLEVDEDSRLGRELLAGGSRYHAHFVPDEEATADFYLKACEQLESAGIRQYEISNFARDDFESRHNLKYWMRQPYFGFGVDAHSMLRSTVSDFDAVRFASPDSLEQYLSGGRPQRIAVSSRSALEENFFLGLRLKRGINLSEIAAKFGGEATKNARPTIAEFVDAGLMEQQGDWVRLTSSGRLLSNEVFERFMVAEPVVR